MPSNGVTSATVGVSFALGIVWMQRQQRWALFLQALTGRWQIVGSRTSGSVASTGGGSATTPSTTVPSTPAPGTVGAINPSTGKPIVPLGPTLG